MSRLALTKGGQVSRCGVVGKEARVGDEADDCLRDSQSRSVWGSRLYTFSIWDFPVQPRRLARSFRHYSQRSLLQVAVHRGHTPILPVAFALGSPTTSRIMGVG